MGTRFIRKGHERINSHGTRSWVTEHEVNKNYFTVTKVANRSLINGKETLRETRCKHCRAIVFEVVLPKGRNVYFNNDYNPLVRHKCEQSKSLILEKGSPRKAKRFLSDAAVAAQDREINELRARRKKRELQQLEKIKKKKESLSKTKKSLEQKIQKMQGVEKQKINISNLQLNLLKIDMQLGLLSLGIASVSKLPAGHKLKILEKKIKKEKLQLEEQQRALSSQAGRDIVVKIDKTEGLKKRKVSTSKKIVGSRRLRKIKQDLKTKYGAKRQYLLIERYSIERDLSTTQKSFKHFQQLIDQNKNLLETIENKEKLKKRVPLKKKYDSLRQIEEIIANYKKAIKDLRLKKSSSNGMLRRKIETEILQKDKQISKLEKEKSFFDA